MRETMTASTAPYSLLLACCFMLLVPCHVKASITILETAKSFPSRPEKKLGHQLWKGSEYMGRMQFVHGNLQLCKSAQDPHRRFFISESMDGLPIAIYAKSGGCTLEEKAYVASNLLEPPNIVGYLIVDDDRSSRSKKRKNDTSFASFLQPTELLLADDNEDLLDDFIGLIPGSDAGETDEDLGSLWEELMVQVQNRPPVPFEARTLPPLEMDVMLNDLNVPVQHLIDDDETTSLKASTETQLLPNTDDASASDDEMIPLPLERFRVKQGENAWWRGGDEIQGDDAQLIENDGHRNLKHHRDSDNINVAILHVTSRVGYELLDLLLKENSEVGRLGGPKILLNSKEPNATARTIIVWALMSIILGGCACCCMLVCLEYVGEEEQRAPPQPNRRRLTSNQVREKFPAFHYHPENHVEQPLDDECAICLDDFSEGMRLRRLPCGHVFHSTCISRWLIERSAFCPLCKVDLYEAEAEEDNQGNSRANSLQQRYGVLQGVTSWLGQRSGPTPNAHTTLNSSWFSWWSRPRPTSPPTRTPPNAEVAAAPAAPPARAFQWTYNVVPSAPVETDNNTTGASTSISPLAAAASRWFTRRRRMGVGGTEESRMLTELTEPLIPSGAAGNPEISSPSSESAPIVTEGSSPITPREELSTQSDDGERPSSSPSTPGTSTPIEV